MKVKVIRSEGTEYNFEKGWLTEGKVYPVIRKHSFWKDGYFIRDNDGEALLFWEHELVFVED